MATHRQRQGTKNAMLSIPRSKRSKCLCKANLTRLDELETRVIVVEFALIFQISPYKMI